MRSLEYKYGDEEWITPLENSYTKDLLPHLADAGGAMTVWNDDRPIVIMGIVPVWSGVIECWTLVDANTNVPAICLVKMVKWWLDTYCEKKNIRRADSVSMTEKQFKWMSLLGFEFEYTKLEAGPNGEDVTGMTKIYRRLH